MNESGKVILQWLTGKEITSVNTYSEFAKFFLDHIDHLEKRLATLEAKIAQLEDKT